jgi:hypothetical protein
MARNGWPTAASWINAEDRSARPAALLLRPANTVGHCVDTAGPEA